jgi:hypothetical protein
MVDAAECCANRSYLYDFIRILPDLKRAESAKIADLYRQNGLSRAEIADCIGICKTAVSGHLKAAKIKEKHTGRDPNNYKFPKNPPYGFKVVDGKLTENPREIKISRLIIQLKDREGLTWAKVVEKLNAQGLKSRIGPWTVDSARNARARWKGKI